MLEKVTPQLETNLYELAGEVAKCLNEEKVTEDVAFFGRHVLYSESKPKRFVFKDAARLNLGHPESACLELMYVEEMSDSRYKLVFHEDRVNQKQAESIYNVVCNLFQSE